MASIQELVAKFAAEQQERTAAVVAAGRAQAGSLEAAATAQCQRVQQHATDAQSRLQVSTDKLPFCRLCLLRTKHSRARRNKILLVLLALQVLCTAQLPCDKAVISKCLCTSLLVPILPS